MALSVEHREHLERLIECAVCMDISNDPRRLPCGHSFCFSCLQGLWTSSQPTSKVRCPQCRKDHWLGYEGPRSIPKDFIIDQIKEMLASMTPSESSGPQPSRCEFCLSHFPSTAKYLYCLACDSLMCTECSQKHRCSKGTPKSVIKLDFQCSLICQNHKHPVRFICDDCNKQVCKRCQVQGVCGDHDLFDVFLGRFLNDEPAAKGKPKRQPKAVPKYAAGVFVGLENEAKKGNNSLRGKPQDVKKPQPAKPSPTPKPKETPKKEPVSRPKSAVPNVAVIAPKATAKVRPAPPPPNRPKTEIVNITPDVTCMVTKTTTTAPAPAPIQQRPPPQPPAIITPSPVVEESDLPWRKNLSVKGRSVTILPSGDFAILTEKCVYLIEKNGEQLDSFSDIEDPWGVTFWSQYGSVVISERRQRRLSVFTVTPKKKKVPTATLR